MGGRDTTIGGYQFYTGSTNHPYANGSDRVLQTAWAGAKYEVGAWAFTGAYYHIAQDAFVRSSGNNCAAETAANVGNAAYLGIKTGLNCSGDANVVSGLVDYTFNKHFDVYTGVSWSDVGGGLSSNFVGGLENTTVVSGLRLKF